MLPAPQPMKLNNQGLRELAGHDLRLFPNGFQPALLGRLLAQGSSWVAWINHELAGYALVDTRTTTPDMLRLAVLEPYRRRGVARALVRAVLRRHQRCVLQVRPDNAPARHLYRQEGFRVVGVWNGSLILRSEGALLDHDPPGRDLEVLPITYDGR